MNFDPAIANPYLLHDVELAELHAFLDENGIESSSPQRTPFVEPFSDRSLLVPPSWFRRSSRTRSVRKDDFWADLEILESVFLEASPLRTIASERSIDIDAFFTGWKRFISRLPADFTAETAFYPWLLLRFTIPDNHSGPMLPTVLNATPARSYLLPLGSAPEALRIVGGQAALNSLRRHTCLHFDGDALCEAELVSSSLEIEGVLRNGTWEHPAPLAPASRESPHGGVIERLPDGAIYCRVAGMGLDTDDEAELHDQARALVATQPPYIAIDLRGIGGGSFSQIAPLLEVLFGASLQRELSELRLERKPSVLWKSLSLGLLLDQWQNRPCWPERWRHSCRLYNLETPPLVSSSAAGSFARRPDPWSSAPEHPRAVVLVDRYTASDAELTAALLRMRSGSLLIGENTFGMVDFIQPGCFVLPRSKITMRIARGRSNLFGDGTPIDGFGLPIDIALDWASLHDERTVLTRLAATARL